MKLKYCPICNYKFTFLERFFNSRNCKNNCVIEFNSLMEFHLPNYWIIYYKKVKELQFVYYNNKLEELKSPYSYRVYGFVLLDEVIVYVQKLKIFNESNLSPIMLGDKIFNEIFKSSLQDLPKIINKYQKLKTFL